MTCVRCLCLPAGWTGLATRTYRVGCFCCLGLWCGAVYWDTDALLLYELVPVLDSAGVSTACERVARNDACMCRAWDDGDSVEYTRHVVTISSAFSCPVLLDDSAYALRGGA